LAPRGTRKREDLLDTIVGLRHPSDYDPGEGLRVEVQFEKTRYFCGHGAEPFEVSLVTGSDGVTTWVTKDLDPNG
jgi:hypothetical protein